MLVEVAVGSPVGTVVAVLVGVAVAVAVGVAVGVEVAGDWHRIMLPFRSVWYSYCWLRAARMIR